MSAEVHLAASVGSILDRDATTVQTLNEILMEEREALKTRDAGRLYDLVTRKLECLKSMEQIDRERKVCMRRAHAADWPSLIQAVDTDDRLGLVSRWQQLVLRLREAAELTEINSRIVSRTRYSTERMLAMLRGQSEPVGVYDKSGRTHAYGDNRPIVSA